MIDLATERRLQDVIRKEARSFLQYVSEADPFTSARNEKAWPVILEHARQDRAGVQELITLMLKNKKKVQLESYPILFTTVNFASLDYLLPRLIEDIDHRRAGLESFEKDLEQGPVRFHLHGLVETKKKQLETLRGLVAS